MTEPGLSIESAASVTARHAITQHLTSFHRVIRTDRAASQSTVAAYVDGLAGVVALTIAGGHGSREDVIEATIKLLREAIDRDLTHLTRGK
jgi:site-specific recombinase XerC